MADQRIAAIADIHGNAPALRAVLADIARHAPDLIVNLGDHFSGPLAAGETAEILLARPDIVSIRGNHDRYLVDQEPARMGPSDAVAHAELSAEALDWLGNLPATHAQDGLFCCHGTPESDTTYWLHELVGDRVIPRPRDGIAALAGAVTADLFLCAHTHLPRAVRLQGGAWVVNPGSVGCPAYDDDHPVYHVVEAGHPDASYAIIDRTGGKVAITHRTVPYDATKMASRARAHGRDGWARAVSTGWYAP